jgi:hypothetical protein
MLARDARAGDQTPLEEWMTMSDIVTIFKQIDFLSMVWLFFIAFVIHEAEEWNITDFELRNFVGVPATVTRKNARMWIGIICGVGLVWCAAATWRGNPTLAAYVFLPAVALALGNALQHVFWTFYFRQYAPGVISAVVLLIPLGGTLAARAVQQEGWTSHDWLRWGHKKA